MNKNVKGIFKSKGFYVALATGICMVLVLGYTINGIKKAGNDLSELNEAQKKLENAKNDISSNYELALEEDGENQDDTDNQTGENTGEELGITEGNSNEKSNSDISSMAEQTTEGKTTDNQETVVENAQNEINGTNVANNENVAEENGNSEQDSIEVMGNDSILEGLSFDEETGLAWPVNGNVIKSYSVDSLVYFQTLGQFKSNPAIFIASEVGTAVTSAHNGVVTNVSESKEFGNLVEITIGEDYVLTYGQIEDISVKTGDKVSEGDVIGCIAKPTGYYSLEGSHLYFKVAQASETVDPMLLLR